MFYQITKLNRVRDHPDCVDKDMRVHNITTVKTKGEVLGNSNIGTWFCLYLKSIFVPIKNNNYYIYVCFIQVLHHFYILFLKFLILLYLSCKQFTQKQNIRET